MSDDKYGIPGTTWSPERGYVRHVGDAQILPRYGPPTSRHQTQRNIANRGRVVSDFVRVLKLGEAKFFWTGTTVTAGSAADVLTANYALSTGLPSTVTIDAGRQVIGMISFTQMGSPPDGLVVAGWQCRLSAINSGSTSVFSPLPAGEYNDFELNHVVRLYNPTGSDIAVASASYYSTIAYQLIEGPTTPPSVW